MTILIRSLPRSEQRSCSSLHYSRLPAKNLRLDSPPFQSSVLECPLEALPPGTSCGRAASDRYPGRAWTPEWERIKNMLSRSQIGVDRCAFISPARERWANRRSPLNRTKSGKHLPVHFSAVISIARDSSAGESAALPGFEFAIY
jgi:hypothetical protein